MDPSYTPLPTRSSASRHTVDDPVRCNDNSAASTTLPRHSDGYGPYHTFDDAAYIDTYLKVTTPGIGLDAHPAGPTYRPDRSTSLYPGSAMVDQRWRMQAPNIPHDAFPNHLLRSSANTRDPSYLPLQPGPSSQAMPGSAFSLLDDHGNEMAPGSVQHWTTYGTTYERSAMSSLPQASAHLQSTSLSTQFAPATSSDPRALIILVPLPEDVAPCIHDGAMDFPKHVYYDDSYLAAAQRPTVASNLRETASVRRRGGLAPIIHHCPYDTCKATLTRVSNLKDHILVHQDNKLYACPSVGCPKCFNTRSLRESHVKHMHKTMATA